MNESPETKFAILENRVSPTVVDVLHQNVSDRHVVGVTPQSTCVKQNNPWRMEVSYVYVVLRSSIFRGGIVWNPLFSALAVEITPWSASAAKFLASLVCLLVNVGVFVKQKKRNARLHGCVPILRRAFNILPLFIHTNPRVAAHIGAHGRSGRPIMFRQGEGARVPPKRPLCESSSKRQPSPSSWQ